MICEEYNVAYNKNNPKFITQNGKKSRKGELNT
jgi:hypothetical protein